MSFILYSISKENERRLRRSIVWSILLLIMSAGGLIFWTALFFTAPAQPNTPLPAVIGGLWVLPIFTFTFLRRQLRTTRRVALYNRGLLIVHMFGELSLIYPEIARVEQLDDSAESSRRHLMLSLKDPRGRELARIKDSLDNFDHLTWELRRRVGWFQGASPADFSAADRRSRLLQRAGRARTNVICGLILLLMSLAGTLATVHDYRQDRRLRTVGLTAEAEIIEHYIYNDRAYRLEYQFQAQNGRTYGRDLMLSREDWSRLRKGETISIRYLADDPAASLVPLEEEKKLGFFLIGGLFMLLLGGGGLLLGLTGCEAEYINGKFYFLRRGELLEDKLPG